MNLKTQTQKIIDFLKSDLKNNKIQYLFVIDQYKLIDKHNTYENQLIRPTILIKQMIINGLLIKIEDEQNLKIYYKLNTDKL